MNTAAEYRAEIQRLENAVLTQGEQAVRNGYITRDEYEAFVQGVGIERPLDPETQAAKEELEAFQLRLQQATRSFLPNGKRDEALRLIGCPVPEGRVGRLAS